MGRGIDTTANCQALAQEIKDAGYHFVCRYYNRNRPQKNLVKAEAQALSAVGLSIVAVWENGFPTSAAYFNYETGKKDGADAAAYARGTIGQPDGSPIYFTVDYDASAADLAGPVHAYFTGLLESLAAEKGGRTGYAAGVYGSGQTCEQIRAAFPAIQYAWLAESGGWSGSRQFSAWNLKQLQTETVCGLSVDTNQSNGDGGGFRLHPEG
ncbi:DUF1906 domain-containing protein [Saccharibacillus sp. CPCC 101409]|uniref:DUF1906 domain-containing protein n=1 Tax=Saccharibacillus sp. CPCC 101409 TaxID=3058041 RepID=UPI0026719854|nr:DUF1906 domain-containing protein [Saccharibacillus sp. CPCC 101409]MDO3412387.1 DUF1906 domain-containing protein [Saccharibacillus sp. CPCC 101409]